MNRKFLLLLLVLTSVFPAAFAQSGKMKVVQFDMDVMDRSATQDAYSKTYDGKTCSIIKVQTNEKGFEFDGGYLTIPWKLEKTGEIWLWVQPGSKRITITHEDYGKCEYIYGDPIESGRVYRMVLETPQRRQIEIKSKCDVKVVSVVSDVITDFKGDLVYVNDSLVGLTPCHVFLESGAYRVKVKHETYEKEQSVIIDKETYREVTFKFTRKYNITTDRMNDEIYIDGNYRGSTPLTIDLSYGEHQIKAKRRDGKYNEVEEMVEPVEDVLNNYPKLYEISLYTPQYHFTKKTLVFATLNVGIGFLDYNFDNGYLNTYLQKSYGFTVGSVRKVGWYFSAMSNFNFKAFNADYVADGDYYFDVVNSYGDFVDGNYPFYSGESCSSRLSIMGGLLLKMGSRTCFRLGAGYGRRAFAYSDQSGKWVRPSRFDKNGLDLALGLQFNNKNRFVLSFDVVSTSFSTVEAKVGMGVCLHQDKVFKKK